MATGVLVLVVGPSGAGKDTLLDAARLRLTDGAQFRFVRRVITRPAEAGGEAHEAVTEAEFAARQFALSWHAHGLWYGIPADIAGDIAAGRIVVANVSRSVIAQASRQFPVHVIEVSAPPALLAQRLAYRRRENAAAIGARLTRVAPVPDWVATERVLNDSTPVAGATRFLAALIRAAAAGQRSGTVLLEPPD